MTYRPGRHFLLVSFFTLVFLLPQNTFAADPPNPISPADNSTENKSPKLTWEYSGECIESGSCFRVEIDNNPDFSSIEKSTYTNNFSYSPQGLAEEIWNWRVKAKDKSEKWSDWSRVFKFSININSPTPPPSPSPSSSSSQTSTQPSPTAQSSQKNLPFFEIKNTPSEINSNQEFEVQVALSIPNSPNQTFYLKGAFKKDGSSNYFGKTYSNEWVENSEKYLNQLKISTNSEGSWERKVKIKPDEEDSGFEGTGSYIFKAARYTDSGSGPTWSNEIRITINAVNNAEPSVTNKKVEENSGEKKEIDLTASLVKDTPTNYEISKLKEDTFKIASVAGVSSISNNTILPENTKVLSKKSINLPLVALGLGVLAAGVGFVFYKIKKEKISAKSYN